MYTHAHAQPSLAVVVACLFTATLGVVMRFPLEWCVGGCAQRSPSSCLFLCLLCIHLFTHHHHHPVPASPHPPTRQNNNNRTIVVREYFSGSNAIGPYMCARFLCNLPLGYGPFLLATVIYWMTGQSVHVYIRIHMHNIYVCVYLCWRLPTPSCCWHSAAPAHPSTTNQHQHPQQPLTPPTPPTTINHQH